MKKIVVRALLLGFVFCTNLVWAEAPMDLDSPFPKVLLFQSKTGEVERREIKKAKRLGEDVEVEKAAGGIMVLPVKNILLIIPTYPKEDLPCTNQDVDAAIRLLEGLPSPLALQAGVDSKILEAWKQLKDHVAVAEKQKKEQDAQEQKTKEVEAKAKAEQEVRDWLGLASEFRRSRSEKELNEMREAGEGLARRNPDIAGDILDALAVLSQVQPKEKGEALPDLSKLNQIQYKVVPDDLLGWLTGGCLVLSFCLLLFGLGFLSSSLTRFKEGALLSGVFFGLCSLSILGALGWTWWPTPISGSPIQPNTNANMEELVLYIKNRIQPVYYFPKKTFTISVDEWRSAVLAWLPPSEESTGLFKAKLGHGSLFTENGRWSLRQPITALGIPLPITFTFEGKTPEVKNWDKPAIEKIYLGHWPLPNFIRGMVAESAENIWQQGLSSIGLSGVPLEIADQGMIVVSMPAAGTKPKYELTQLELKNAAVSEVKYKKELSAEELAQAIVGGHGKEFLNKFVTIYGEVFSVGGSNFSSTGKIGRDQLKDIFLMGIKNFYGKDRHLLVKCQIKGDVVFQMDEKSDLYMRYVIQEYEQDKKVKNQNQNSEKLSLMFRTIDGVEVTSPDIDPAKETPLVYRGHWLQFQLPQRIELNAKEIESGSSVGGVTGRPAGSNLAGEIALYGLVLRLGGNIGEIISEKEF